MNRRDFLLSTTGLLVAPASLAAAEIPGSQGAGVEERADGVVIFGPAYSVVFSRANGSITSVAQTGHAGSILASGEQGLWEIGFQDGSRVNAAAAPGFRYAVDRGPAALRLSLSGPDAEVAIGISHRNRLEEVGR
jgi:hypothetical protein